MKNIVLFRKTNSIYLVCLSNKYQYLKKKALFFPVRFVHLYVMAVHFVLKRQILTVLNQLGASVNDFTKVLKMIFI